MAAPADNSITVRFGWIGPTKWDKGPLHVGVIDLIFKNAQREVSVEIPENLSPDRIQMLPFTCYVQQNPFFRRESHSDTLTLTAEEIRNLTMKAGMFEERKIGPATLDSSGRITHETGFLRSDRKIEMEIPENLEVGQEYRIQVTSDNLSLKARLVREEGVAPVDVLSSDEKNDALTEEQKVVAFNLFLSLSERIQIDIKKNFGADVLGDPYDYDKVEFKNNAMLEAIGSEVKKIKEDVLKDAVAKIRFREAPHEHQTWQERDASVGEIIRISMRAIGPQGFVNIMRSTLEILFQRKMSLAALHIPQACEEYRLRIAQVSEGFRKVYEERVNPK